MRHILLLFPSLLLLNFAYSQDEEGIEPIEESYVDETFLDTRIINAHSVETLNKGVLEFRIQHRFGDIAGDFGGAQTFYGLDNAADIRFAFEYGITDKLQIGLGRSKGTGEPYRSLIDGFAKYRILHQTESNKVPFSLSGLAMATTTYMKASEDISQVSHFPEWQHRMAYCLQLNAARRFGNWLSVSLMPTMVHRNYVAADDVNTLFAMGGAARIGITSKMALLLEYFHVFNDPNFREEFTNSLGVGIEWKTFGHNFAIHLTNSKGFGETQYIPYTFSEWMDGEFRLGFSISRKFSK